MATQVSKLLGKIHQGDCVKGLQKVPAGSVDLAFADPPFNIGFKYDEYEDQLEDEHYLKWSGQWMSEIHRVLKDDGTFWLAIGDEYAAELKVEAQKIGFHCRSWVIWYYTFGVNCKKKFTRSHAHLFHFVKDKTNFTFNHEDLDLRVPSARRLIYNDARANPNGRMPDDTWILRPQELVNGFALDEDTWHFPRVAGTFKERAGFHGCQMPEQLLGRIIRACSSAGETVIDPFSGSSTTLAVAKKMGREFFGFELSKEYVRLGSERLGTISSGDPLVGAAEPSMANLLKKESQNGKASSKGKGKQKSADMPLFPTESKIHDSLSDCLDGVVEAFKSSHGGFSLDRVVADPILNEDFQLHCDRLSIPGTAAERNRFLFRVRKSGTLKSFEIKTQLQTKIDWPQVSSFLHASEIAWRQISDKYCLSLDEIFCDPRIATQFDQIAESFAPGFQSIDYRWAALKLRKEGSAAKKRASMQSPKQLGIVDFKSAKLKKQKGKLLSKLKLSKVPEGPGVYLVREPKGKVLYAGETACLQSQFDASFSEDGPRSKWLQRTSDVEIFWLSIPEIAANSRFARQSWLLKWHEPLWNAVKELACET